MIIRKATPWETEGIINYAPVVMKEATMGFVRVKKEAAIQMMPPILANGGYYLVYEEDDVIQGWIAVGKTYNLHSKEIEGMIPELYVLPTYRKRGVAKKLFKYVFNTLNREGFKKVHLNVYSGNPVKRLYEKLGFHDVSTMMEKHL